MNHFTFCFATILMMCQFVFAQSPADRWTIDPSGAIVWDAAHDANLPHDDHLEMSGEKVSVVVRFGADKDGNLQLSRRVIWPTLHAKPKNVRGYLKHDFNDESTPQIKVGDNVLPLPPIEQIRFDGVLTIVHKPQQGVQITSVISPCREQFAIVQRYEITNVSDSPLTISVAPVQSKATTQPNFVVQAWTDGSTDAKQLHPKETLSFGVVMHAKSADDPDPKIDSAAELQARQDWLKSIASSLRFESPDDVLNRMFAMAKIRTTESIYNTKMGLVHSPGGERYYGGVWANDQCEYANPFFPFVGDPTADAAALNAYRIFAKQMTPDYKTLPSSVEIEGDVLFRGAKDRGDAAMIAYGASRFALASGDKKIGEELWPHIQWCLEYCKRKITADGVIASNTDELENRFPAGKANLSTSTLCYLGLRGAANLGRSLGESPDVVKDYDQRADDLRSAIEKYFGADVEGFHTYRYYDGNDVLRAWICLPLTAGIYDRTRGTVDALFSPKLWTVDGLATQSGKPTFWDRSTLYALRGVFAAGETETALKNLDAYSHRRLLGEHVPYPVEANPEGNQAHLAAESALYCRIFTEGIFGIVPTGFRSFTCSPRLPKDWPTMALREMKSFGHSCDLEASRAGQDVRLVVKCDGKVVLDQTGHDGETMNVTLPD